MERETSAQVWQRIQELREEYLRMLEIDTIESAKRMDEIPGQIRRLEARYRELGGILHGSCMPDEEDDTPS